MKVAVETKEEKEEPAIIEKKTDGKDIILNEGDSLYFDSNKPHGMQALDGKPVKFLAVIM